jgi:hypothetical protein
LKKILLLISIILLVLIGCSTQPTVVCNKPYILVGTECCLDQNDNSVCDKDEKVQQQQPSSIPTPTPDNSCVSQFTDTEHMDIFDSHVHINSKLGISISQIITEMDKAGVSVSNLYSGSLEDLSKYPSRFVIFVDTPDSPQPSTWFKQGQAFVTSVEKQLKTGKFYGIGEANLRYFGPDPSSTVYVAPDSPLWLQLVDLSAQYQVPISFHFVPDDPVANAAFERMLNHNKDAILIWAHLGFNQLPLNRTALNDFLLRYPHLYFDTAGIQNMNKPLPEINSNWWVLANQSGLEQQQGQQGGQQTQQSGQQNQQNQQGQQPQGNQQPGQQGGQQNQQGQGDMNDQNGGRLNGEWKQFFETWNSRILFASDAGGGSNGLERWLNYVGKTSDGAPPNAVGHWTRLLSNLDYNAARNILSGNARELFLKEQRPPYDYLVSSDGKCYHIFVSSTSSVSALTFNQGTRTITFTVADSIGTTGSAAITIPTALVGGNFTASVDGQSVQIKEVPNSTYTTINLEYAGGIRSITLSAPGNTLN